MQRTWLPLLFALACLAPDALFAAKKSDAASPPHTPTLCFLLSNVTSQRDADAIGVTVAKLKSVMTHSVNVAEGFVLVRFDSHVASYHQVAQAVAEAGKRLGKSYDPRLKITIPEYPHGDNAAKVDAVLAGKRLNQRVKVEQMDKTKGVFLLRFLPLELDASITGPQGFNGGHINHPIHDPPPRGLGLTCIYASEAP